MIIANLKIPTDTYDVNVSPDKRTIFIHNEGKIAEAILEQLKEQLEPSRSTFQLNSLMSENSLTKPISAVNTDNSSLTSDSGTIPTSASSNLNSTSSMIAATPNYTERVYNRSTSPGVRLERNFAATRLLNNTSLGRGSSSSSSSSNNSSNSRNNGVDRNNNDTSSVKRPASLTSWVSVIKKHRTEETDERANEDEALENETMEVDVIENTIQDYNDEESEIPIDTDMENQEPAYVGIKSTGGFWNTEGKSLRVSSDMSNMLQLLKEATTVDETPSSVTSVELATLENASIKNTVDNEIATEALSRVIHKPDFARMKVLGQFNLGFIIASLDDKDLYIIDQHASDEKYNFETLQEVTRIETQKLIR